MEDARKAEQPQEIALAEMIETLRSELEVAQMQGAARPVAFGVEKVELELKVVVSRKAKGEGGIKFWVVTAGVSAEGGSETVHNFKLTLSPLDAETKKRLEVGSNIKEKLDRNR
ncbi:MAG TPA: trypco2 family protein [Bradyrhizobium sp.]|nr:trypco2 family protein [Bradyrhizobium sp.]